MLSRFVVPSLAALALVPAAQAFEIDTGDASLSIEPRIQSRIEFASASDAAGNDYDIWDTTSTDPQSVNMYIRRARLYFKGKAFDNIKFEATLYADEIGAVQRRDGTGVDFRYATVGWEQKTDDMKHYVRFGLQKQTAVAGDFDSSSKQLFPNGRLSASYAGPRSVGLAYFLTAPMFNLRVGLADEPDSTPTDNNDWHFFARIATGLKEDWALDKRSESFLGKEGFAHEVGLGFDIRSEGSDPDNNSGATVISLDYNVHYNQISGNVDLLLLDQDAGNVSGQIFLVQGAYAVPLESGAVVEPALRFTLVDNDTDDDNELSVLEEEGGESGTYIDLGVNYYINKHNNKFQAGIQIFSAEDGEGDATVFRIGHQLEF